MTRTKTKVTITVDRGVLAQVRAGVSEGRAASVSAYIEHAIRGQLAAEAGFDATIAEMLTESGGPPTDRERAAARHLLSIDAA